MLRVLILIAFAACSSAPPVTSPPPGPPQEQPTPPEPTPSVPAPPPPVGDRADGADCLEAAQCASGICEGEGCGPDSPGNCAPQLRGCTRDLRPYCGCDGQTFRTSGSCPGKRFSARAACP